MIKKFLLIALVSVSLSSYTQMTLNSSVTSTQLVEDPIAVRMVPGFRVAATSNLTFHARIANSGIGTVVVNPLCGEKYGKIIISEIHFDTRYNERIESKYHHFGEYIELYNSSNVAVSLDGWVIRDNHTMFKFKLNEVNTDLIIQPGGYKIITYNGFYAYGANGGNLAPAGGATSALGGRNKFVELFPEIAALNFNLNDIILQNTMVLYNNTDKISLFSPNGNLSDQVAYNNTGNITAPAVWTNTVTINPKIDNEDGGVFNGPIGWVYVRDPITGQIVLDGDNNPVMVQNDNFKKAIYRSVVDSYYSNGDPLDFSVATASPGTMPQVTVPLKDLDPFIFYTPDNNANATETLVYDIKDESLIGKSKTYYNGLGNPTVSLTKDFQTNIIWGSEVVYDYFGRKSKESFSTPTCLDFQNINYLSESSMKSIFLDNYYNDTNTLEPFQANAQYPYTEINYDNLNPGNTINIVGGNQIGGQWKTGYSYTVPAAQEMYYVYGYNYYDGLVTSGKEEIITKFYKSVSVDANGVENVSFSDGEGKVLAVARSGGAATYPVFSLIGTQGFIDVHIPAGITSAQISLLGATSLYKVFDLKTGYEITPITSTTFVGGNAYRIVAITPPTTDPKMYVTNVATGGVLSYDLGALGISYRVNYYDYSVNVYNKTGQLIKAVQPNGYTNNIVIKDVPVHMIPTATAFISTFVYNDQGQVRQVTSADEGTSKFAYRKDGKIRYSQSELQSVTLADTKVSYTDYDTYGRPIESGVITDATGIWASALASLDVVALIAGTRSEQTFTIYDYEANNTTSVAIPATLTLSSVLTSTGISPTNYIQTNLSGNVAITFTKTATTVNAITWYSYDLYGRVIWVVQYNEGILAKTIHYYYDYKGNVKKIIYQKDNQTELFVHQYDYDLNNVLKKVETSTDNVAFITHADYSYYLSGELKRTNIAQGTQGLDYVYTLGGMLKSINHPSLEQAKDPGNDTNDVFGITLDYYSGDYLRSGSNITSAATGVNQDYNGNIKAVRWGNKGVPGDYTAGVISQKAYQYDYNRNNWLTAATFGTTNNTATITPATSFRENALTYDPNGNIKTLQRTNNAGTVVDNLAYNYTNVGKNQLNNIKETAAVTADPTDIETQATGNYVYDALGQLTRNVLENLYYYYNTQGLVTEVRKGTLNPVVKFYYNERGQRVKKESFNTAFPFGLVNTDYYVLDLSGNTIAVYKKPAAGVTTQNELPIYGLTRLGVFYKASNTSKYEITDHLGNVREVISKVSGNPVIQSYADYYPFGEQLPLRNSLSNYRYAFQGQELDSETNMEAFQLRLWDGRIGRWLSPDPAGQHFSPYSGMGNNPVNHIDPDGGYETWLGAFFSWVGSGFKGSGVIKNPADSYDPSSKYGVLLSGSFDGGEGSSYKDPSGTTHLSEVAIPNVRYHDKISSDYSNFSDFWNSPTSRSIFPDRLSLHFTQGVAGIVGISHDTEFTWVTRGNDARIQPYLIETISITAGAQASANIASIGSGIGYYPAMDLRKIKKGDLVKSLYGWGSSVGVDAGVVAGGSFSISTGHEGKPLITPPTWITATLTGGFVEGAGARVGVGYTIPLGRN